MIRVPLHHLRVLLRCVVPTPVAIRPKIGVADVDPYDFGSLVSKFAEESPLRCLDALQNRKLVADERPVPLKGTVCFKEIAG